MTPATCVIAVVAVSGTAGAGSEARAASPDGASASAGRATPEWSPDKEVTAIGVGADPGLAQATTPSVAATVRIVAPAARSRRVGRRTGF